MRPEGLSKLGYYPTPEKTSQEIARLLTPKVSTMLCYDLANQQPDAPGQFGITILDPCCGNGTAAKELANHISDTINQDCEHDHQIPVLTYGIEPHTERYDKANQNLDRVTYAPIEQCQIPDNSFDVMLLNPPYDYDNEHDFSRLETYFLSITTPALKPRGILVLIIPQYVVPDAARMLTTNYTDIRAFRMSDPEYKTFRQSILIAQRSNDLNTHIPTQWELDLLTLHAALEEEAESLDDHLHSPQCRPIQFNFEPSTRKSEPHISRIRFNPSEVIQAADLKSAFDAETVIKLITPRIEQPPFRPLEPLRRGHVCLLAANGQLDNIPLFDNRGILDPVIIKGSSNKKLVDVETNTERDTTTAQEHFEAKISVMNLRNGDISVISETADDLSNFFATRQESIDQAVRERYQPSIDPMNPKYARMRERIGRLNRTMMGKQAPSTVVVAAQLRENNHCFCIGQQGSGKTTVAVGAVEAAEFSTVLVVTPTHNVQTWVDEIAEIKPQAKVRVINGIGQRGIPDELTFSLAYAETDIETIRSTPADPDHPIYAIMGRDGPNKLTYPFQISTRRIDQKRPLYRVTNGKPDFKGPKLKTINLIAQQKKRQEQYSRNYYGSNHVYVPSAGITCPNCWVPFLEGKHYPSGRQATCTTCKFNLAGPNIREASDRTFPRARYISKHFPYWADLFIMDEAHQFRGKTSAQAEVYGSLAQRSKRVLALTGTLIGGKASECFRLLASISPSFYDQFSFNDWKKFTETYGRYEIVFENESASQQIGKRSSRRAQGYQPKELNGFHPALMNMFWTNTVFMRITDIKRDIPDPEIYVHVCHLDEQTITDSSGTKTTQAASYKKLETELKKHLLKYLAQRDISPLGQYLQELLVYPENGWQGTSPMDPNSVKDGKPESIITMPALPEKRLYPKEEVMLDIVDDEIKAGRKILIYVTHTKKRNTAKRVLELLTQRMVRVRIMPDGNAKGRLRWIQKTAATTDVIICHPRKVETGLNLLEFPTILWYEHDPSMYTVEQASARSHRANQTKTVHIHHLAYADTMQERYLRLIAEKADTSRMIYGELGTNGLSAFNPSSNELRQIVAREMIRNTKGTIDHEIDAVSDAMADLIYTTQANIQDVFRNKREQQRNNNEWSATELYDGSEFQIEKAKPSRNSHPSQLNIGTKSNDEPKPKPMTWEQWRKAKNLKESTRKPDNQLVMF